VKDTWAKSIITKEYENVEWFAYTSCDKKHPVPEIDYKEHVIYVDAKDDLYSTYDKTQKAYNMIKNHIDFDYVVRTNTSVFLNIDNLLQKIKNCNNNDVLGGCVGYYYKYPDGRTEFQFNMIVGLFMGMSKYHFDIAMSANNNYEEIPSPDDVIISRRLLDVLKNDFNIVSPNNCSTIYPRYKPFKEDDNEILNREDIKNYTIVTDPDIVNESVVIQLRPLYGDLKERSEKGHEFEHFYELYDALD
jgi:hypothetical protein